MDGEARVLTPAQIYTVDGYDAETKTVYEYHGCFFHGCKKCFPIQRQKTHNCHPDRTIEETYEATLKRTAILQAAGYTVIEKWGCEFNHDKKTDPELQTFLESFEMVPPLEPRDAFFGGRTGATKHKQIWHLSSGVSGMSFQPRRSKHLQLLWRRSSRHCPTRATLSPRLPSPRSRKTHLSSLQVLCLRRNAETAP